jgi:hypothetical protein
MNRKIHKPSYDVDIYNKETNRFVGTITRRPTHQREFGNYGAVEYSVLGRKYWSVGGQQLYLAPSVIDKLKSKGELHKPS